MKHFPLHKFEIWLMGAGRGWEELGLYTTKYDIHWWPPLGDNVTAEDGPFLFYVHT